MKIIKKLLKIRKNKYKRMIQKIAQINKTSKNSNFKEKIKE